MLMPSQAQFHHTGSYSYISAEHQLSFDLTAVQQYECDRGLNKQKRLRIGTNDRCQNHEITNSEIHFLIRTLGPHVLTKITGNYPHGDIRLMPNHRLAATNLRSL